MGSRIKYIRALFFCLGFLFKAYPQAGMPHNLTPFIAEGTAPTAAVIVCPGGSYSWLDWDNEGLSVARWLQSEGISAFVLKYRVQGITSFVSHYRLLFRGHQYPDALTDAQEAIRYLRDNANSLNIDPDKIGIMGFSAGGHLSASLAMFSTEAALRPNFIAPIYPVVTLSQGPFVHSRSRRALLGEYRKYNKIWRDSLSLEQHVYDLMPPVFLVNCVDDPIVHYHNSQLLDSALTAHRVPHEYHQYSKGGHGFGVDSLKAGPEAIQWKASFLRWFRSLNL